LGSYNGDRPSPEIEVTPEMIEAGADALRLLDGGYIETPADGAARIYHIMHIAKVAGLAAALREIDRAL
jgi:hypothetical protein